MSHESPPPSRLAASEGRPEIAVFKLHRDRIVRVTSDIPAGTIAGVREQGVCARNIFLGAIGIDLVLNLVVFFGNCQDARAVNEAVRDTQLRGDDAQFVPGKIDKVKKKQEAEKHRRESADERSTVAPEARIGLGHRLKNLRS